MINKDIIINVSRETRKVYLSKSVIGLDNENLQSYIVFAFTDEFVDGVGRLEYVMDEKSNYIMLEKVDETYRIPIRNVITKQGVIDMQLVVTERQNPLGIPLFKSNKFYVYVGDSINAEIPEPEEYALWIDIANAKLIEFEKSIEDCTQSGNYAKEQGDIAKEIGEKVNSEETIRIKNEKERKEQEQARIRNEENRIKSENERETNETTRMRNEEERIDYYTEIKRKVDDGEFNGDSGVWVGDSQPTNESNVWINPDELYDDFEAQHVVFKDGEDLQTKYDKKKIVYDDTAIKLEIEELNSILEDSEDTLNQRIDRVEEVANSAYDLAHEAEIIASGKSTGHVFNTKQEMDNWLSDSTHVSTLHIGDHLYIKNTDEFDHWWDGEQARELETQKVDLSEYVRKTDIDNNTIIYENGVGLKVRDAMDMCFQSVLYGNGESGYRKYKNGMLEQWGVTTSSANGEIEFAMHQPHIDTNFSIFVEPRERGNFYHYAIPTGMQKFACRVQTRDSQNIAVKIQWRSWGRWK